jgi:hypothetical protein
MAVVLFIASPTAAPAKGARVCWKTVITDWTDGRIDGAYSPTCYRQAIAEAPEDLKIYSSLEEDLRLSLRTKARVLAVSRPPPSSIASSSLPSALLAAGGAAVLLAFTCGALLVCRNRAVSGSRARARSGEDASPPPG